MNPASGEPIPGGSGPRPVCFMVMPFRRRKVEGAAGQGVPGELDCDALWDRVFRPVIEELGYLPIRADADTGAVIVKDMLERLAYANLVLADVSLPNGNVYYEIGLRHAARQTGCVLVAASWSRQLFDIDQFRTVRYPLADGLVPEAEAAAIRELLKQSIPKMNNARTPWHEFVSTDAAQVKRAAFRDQSEAMSLFQARMRSARLAAKADRAPMVQSILADISPATLLIPEITCELLVLVRDEAGWKAVLDFVARLPENVRELPLVREQELLALAQAGQPLEAIGRLEELIAQQGESPERHGLIGGRYKRLWKAERDARRARGESQPSADERRYLNKSIEHYTKGMELDLNEYYCSCNLPDLLRARSRTGDLERAVAIDALVVAACDRALKRGQYDEWLRPTLLVAAFRARDIEKAEELAGHVETEGAAVWKLDSVLADLRLAVEQAAGFEHVDMLKEIVQRLESLKG
jgi:hypothetical protein